MLTLRNKIWFFCCILVLLIFAVTPFPVQASDYGTQDLILGSQGSAVIRLHKDLASLGFYTYKIDSSFVLLSYVALLGL